MNVWQPSSPTHSPVLKPKRGRAKLNAVEIPDGYYMLNARATEEAGGVPKYIYLGKGLEEN